MSVALWNKPYGMKEGFCICGGLLLSGAILQWILGSIDWYLLSWPVNIILLVMMLLTMIVCHLLSGKVYTLRWLSTSQAAVPAITVAALLTLIIGITSDLWYLGFWPLVLCYIWLTFVLGLTTIRRIVSFRFRSGARLFLKDTAFALNHLGLWIALVSATIGTADSQKLLMNVMLGQPEWRAIDERTQALVELPVAIELDEFRIDEYPCQALLIDNNTGKKCENGHWVLSLKDTLEYAAPVDDKYVEWRSMGATSAAWCTAVNTKDGKTVEGWVSNGSIMFPFRALRLDSLCSAVMPAREPKRYLSSVTIYTKSGNVIEDTVSVNHPIEIEGWKIYQVSYDETMGRWSTSSEFELVRDPWLPVTYVGIMMMMLGAVCSFVFAGRFEKGGKK